MGEARSLPRLGSRQWKVVRERLGTYFSCGWCGRSSRWEFISSSGITKVNREARDLDSRIEVNPAVSVIAVLFGWIIIVPPFVSIYRTGERIAEMQRAAGLRPTCIPIVGLLLTFVFHLDSLYYQYELNRIWAHYGNPPEGSPVKLDVAAA